MRESKAKVGLRRRLMKLIGEYTESHCSAWSSAVRAIGVLVLLENCDQAGLQVRALAALDSYPHQSDSSEVFTEAEAVADDGANGLFEPSLTPEEPAVESTSQALETGKTYYVSKSGSDSDGLSKATAFRTIQKAADIVRAGDRVVVLAGIYQEWVKSNRDGTATARIRFVSEPRWAAKIAPTKDATSFWLSLGDYTDIDGFTFDSSLGDLPQFAVRGIQSSGKGARIMNNDIQFHRACTEALYYRTGVGIGVGPYDTHIVTEVFGNIIRNTRVAGCSLPPKEMLNGQTKVIAGQEAAGYGIYLACPLGKAYNNIISDFRIGLHLWHAPTGATVSHNLVFSTGPAGVGIVFGCGDAPFIQCKDITVSNNIFMYAKGVAVIREYGNNAAGTNRILNNLIFRHTSNSGGPGQAFMTVAKPVIAGNLVGVDPRLVNYKADGTGDYRLTAASPAIDAASKEGAVVQDFNQGTRTSKADIGPYEYGTKPISPPSSTPSSPPGFTVR